MRESAGPLLSVLIPVRDGERHLGETVESVLADGWRPLEVVVVDDGSGDGSATVAEGFGDPVRCVRRPALGVAAARNTAMAEARGDFLLHLDADDLVMPGSLALRMDALAADPSLEMVVGFLEAFFSPELDEETRSRLGLPVGAQRGHLAGTSIIRAGVFSRVGAFDESWRVSADMDWFLRATDSGVRTLFLPDVVLRRRIHGRNVSLTRKAEGGDRLRILKAALDRRRAAGTPASD